MFNQTAIKVSVWMRNHTSLFYVDIITYPCPNSDAGLALLVKNSVCELISEILRKFTLLQYDANDPIGSQFCACHDSSAILACAKWWPGFIIISHIWVTEIFVKFWLWALKCSWMHHRFVCVLLKSRSTFSLDLSSARECCTYVDLKPSHHCSYWWPSTKQCRCIRNRICLLQT